MRPLVLAAALALLAAPAAAQVEVAPLAAPDYFSLGDRDRDSDLPADLWRGTSPAVARDIIPQIGRKPLSPAAAGLARRVLGAGVAGPEGAGRDPQVAAARVQALLALGDPATAWAAVERAPDVTTNASLAEAAAEAALIAGQDDFACRISDQLTVGRGELYWLRLRAFCQARAGQTAAAQLTLTLANEKARDPVYSRLMNAVLAGAGDPGAASLRNGLDYALSRRLALGMTPTPETTPPAIFAAIAGAGFSDADRAEIARRGAERRALPPARRPLRGDGLPESPGLDADAAALVAEMSKPRGYLQWVGLAAIRIDLVEELVIRGRPLPDPVRFAALALLANDPLLAQAIRDGLLGDSIPGATPTSLALLDAALAANAGRADSPTLDRLVERGTVEGARSPAQPAALVFAAMGSTMGPDARAEFARFEVPKGAATPARLAALETAAGAGLKGETALIALSIAAEAGETGPAPADRARIVSALRRVGLEQDARAFASEGLIALLMR